MTAWLLLSASVPAAVLAALLFTPWGPALLTLLANSKVARAVGVALAVAWTLFVAATRLKRAGRAEALAEVARANAAARADRERIERQVGRLSDADLDRELGRWSR